MRDTPPVKNRYAPEAMKKPAPPPPDNPPETELPPPPAPLASFCQEKKEISWPAVVIGSIILIIGIYYLVSHL